VIRTQVQLTEAQLQELREIARVDDRSLAAVIREAVDDYVRRRNGPTREELWQRALSVAGKYRDPEGKTDVATRHDEYLAEAIESRWRGSS
jgi:hypothetical protein